MNGMKNTSGLFGGDTGGRADKIKTSVPNGSHIIPADVVSGLGQGNTMAGKKVLDHLFPMPGNAKGLPHDNIPGFASGGTVPVYVSDGEYAVHPEAVKHAGKGDQDHGHEIIDHFIVHARKKIIEKMKKLKGPKKR